MFSAYGDVAAFGAYGTKIGSAALMDVTAPVVVLGLIAAAMLAVRVFAVLQSRRSQPTVHPTTLPRPSLRIAA